jgi:signal transduction histidine kinase
VGLLAKYRQGRELLADAAPELAEEAARLEQEIDLPYIQENFPRLFEVSRAGMQRVRDIVRNLCDFARLDEGAFKEVDLNSAIRSTLEILGHELHARKIRVTTELQGLPAICCHPGQVNQVFLNIIMNAIQASSVEGAIEIRSRAESGWALVEVEDHGSGIRPEHLDRLFEPFFTTKPIGQGTGLGLSVSYGIIRDHGGSIEVASDWGRGSRFRVRIPIKGSTAPPAPTEPAFTGG